MPKKDSPSLLPLFEGSRDAVCGIAEGRIVFANSAACSLFSSPLTGENAKQYFPALPKTADEGARIVSELSRGGREYPMTAVRFSGQWVATVSLAEDSVGAISPSVLQRLRSMSFRMRLSIERILARGVESNPYAEILLHNYYSMLHLSNELTDFNALKTGELPLRTQTLDFDRLCRELTDSCRILLREKSLQIDYVSDGKPCPVTADRERLEQLLLILLSNSALHTPPDGSIVLTLRVSAFSCSLTVTDTGSGMSPKELEAIFSPPASDDMNAQGLGLKIASGLARAHGGALVVQSEPEHGTRVGLSLPLLRDGSLLLRDSTDPVSASLLLTELSDVLPTSVYSKKFTD